MKFNLIVATFMVGASLPPMTAAQINPDALAKRAHEILLQALNTEKAFVKVHAAEALIALGEKDEPRRVFQAELPAANEVRPYRIGVWRVLAASSSSPSERAEWIKRVEQVFLDPAAMDRVHAIETLDKLGHVPSGAVRTAAESMARESNAEAVFARWALQLAGDHTALPALIAGLGSDDPITRLRSAYVLRWLKLTDPVTRAQVARTAGDEPPTAVGYTIILGAAVTLDADPKRTPEWVATLEQTLVSGTAGARYDACQTLMRRYTVADLPKLVPSLDHPEGDARIGAAWAILHVANKTKTAGSRPPAH